MRHWNLLGEAPIPESEKTLSLYEGKDDFFITISGGIELMNSRKHGSEDALGRLPCERISERVGARVLIGGLGMGFTLSAALSCLAEDAEVMVAELVPEVVEWNHGPLGSRSSYPLRDPRSQVYIGDVSDLLRSRQGYFDVIALDVDNGPEGLTTRSNDWIYSVAGIDAAAKALKPDGILAYWSAGPDPDFSEMLRQGGLIAEEIQVYAHGRKGARHTLWLAKS